MSTWNSLITYQDLLREITFWHLKENNESETCLRIIRKKIVIYGKLTKIKFQFLEVF